MSDARPYRIHVVIEPVDKEDGETGFGFGSTFDPLNESDWFDERIEMWAGSVKIALDRSHRVEVERARKAAEPFWKRWLGA